MKTIVPDNLSLLFKAFAEKDASFLSLSACAFFTFQGGCSQILNVQAMWPAIETALGKDELFDFGMPKPRGEFLVYGSAWSPDPVRAIQVRVRVGNHAKSLHVFGNRHWSAVGAPSQPEPFTSMDICHENAFGGPDFPENPLGKGSRSDASGLQPLPNIQTPGNLVGAPGNRPAPAGLSAWPMTWPQRLRYMGAVDANYLAESWPGMPRGTNSEYFNTAPEDQRIQGFFQGDEAVEILNMHPETRRIITSLPGVRARVFTHRIEAGREVFTEVPCRAETVWLFPEQDRGVVLFRGVAGTESEEHEDVLHLFARWEPLSEASKPMEHYLGLFQEELQPAAEMQAPSDVPEESGQPSPGPAAPASATAAASAAAVAGMGGGAGPSTGLEQLVQEAEALQAQAADMLTRAGLNPDDVFRKALAEQSAPEAAGIEDINDLMADVEKKSKDLLARFNLDEQEVVKQLEARPEIEQPSVDDIISQLRASGISNPEIEGKFLEADASLKEAAEAIAALAGLQPKAAAQPEQGLAPETPTDDHPGPSEADSDINVEQVMARHAAGQSLARLDLTGLDFTGLNLSGADFTETVLDRCIFRGANLSKAVFTGAILTDANLEGAELHESDLSEANAASASLPGANLHEADLSQGDFSRANLAGANMSRSNLTGAIFEQAGMNGVQAQGIQAARAGFMAADLTGADMTGANLEEADFSAANLTRANLNGIKAPELRLHGTMCAEAVFKDAVLIASRSDREAYFAGANLKGANLCQSCWDGVNLSGANLTGALLDNADFSRASLANATLRLASAREANFLKADLGGADLTSINLFKAVLRKAILVNATLRSSNLYGVDLYKARIGNTDFADANLKRTLLGMGIVQ